MTILSYLRFSLLPESDLAQFEEDLHAMLELARAQSGYRWAEMGPTMTDSTGYIVVSEWEDIEDVRAWEHIEEHEGVMQRWEPSYREPLVHQRFVPWRRPES
jgi:heme-degrading monooxygenase HmoA